MWLREAPPPPPPPEATPVALVGSAAASTDPEAGPPLWQSNSIKMTRLWTRK
jgi:hypothetical protein